jgi:hypothetical protein
VEHRVDARTAEVAVELRDLVLEHEVVAERVEGQLAEGAVVLVAVAPPVREDEVGPPPALDGLEVRLDLRAVPREDVLGEGAHLDAQVELVAEVGGRGPRLLGARPVRREHHPVDDGVGVPIGQLQDGAPATDLDVVAVGAQHQQARCGAQALQQRAHQAAPSQTCHGARPA